MVSKIGVKLVLAALLLAGTAGCSVGGFGTQATPTTTRTPRPTFTPLAQPTNTFVPLPTLAPTLPPAPTTAPTKPKTATRTPTRKPPTPKPATATPPGPAPATNTPVPVASTYEFHTFPSWCEHSGGTWIKGTVFLDKGRTSVYAGAIVALGAPDGSAIWVDPVKSGPDGIYSFTLSMDGAPPNKGTFGIWLVTPDMKRKSDVGGPITIDGNQCWGGFVDFYK